MLGLHSRRRQVSTVRDLLFLSRRTVVEAAGATDVTDAIYCHVVDNRRRVHVGDVYVGDVIDGAVVVEVSVAPVAAFVAVARIPEAVVHAAVKSDLGRPVPGIPDEQAVFPGPIS